MKIFSAFRRKTSVKTEMTDPQASTSREVPFRLNHARWQASALIDVSTYAVLAASTNVPGINFLNECVMDTFHVMDIGNPNYTDNPPLTTIDGSLAHWTWSGVSRTFVCTRADVLTDELSWRSRLAIEKLNAVSSMMRFLTRARSRLQTGVNMQEIVYATKALQAQNFRSTGYDEKKIMDYPFVFQYADFAGLTNREATDEIILKAKLDDDVLAKTELLRVVYFDQLKKASDMKDITKLMEAFYRETFINSMI